MTTTADTLAAQADQAYTDAKTLSDNAIAASDAGRVSAEALVAGLNILSIAGGGTPVAVDVNPITKPVIPNTDFSIDVKNAFDYAFQSFNTELQPQIQNYISAFFPDISTLLKGDSDQWLIDTITDGKIVPIDVENALWNRARDKENIEALRMEQELIDSAATRGFAAPTGVLSFSINSLQQDLALKLVSLNREITIKNFDILNENTKFAITEAVKLRTSFVAALGEFLRTAMMQPNNAAEYAKVILQSKTGLYDSATRLYLAQIDEERLRSTTGIQNVEAAIHANSITVTGTHDYWTERITAAKVQADVAIAAADQLGRIAASAMATRNSVVSVSAAV